MQPLQHCCQPFCRRTHPEHRLPQRANFPGFLCTPARQQQLRKFSLRSGPPDTSESQIVWWLSSKTQQLRKFSLRCGPPDTSKSQIVWWLSSKTEISQSLGNPPVRLARTSLQRKCGNARRFYLSTYLHGHFAVGLHPSYISLLSRSSEACQCPKLPLQNKAWSRQYSLVPLKRTTSGVPVSFAFFFPSARDRHGEWRHVSNLNRAGGYWLPRAR